MLTTHKANASVSKANTPPIATSTPKPPPSVPKPTPPTAAFSAANAGNMSIDKNNAVNGMSNGDKQNVVANANNTNNAVKGPIGTGGQVNVQANNAGSDAKNQPGTTVNTGTAAGASLNATPGVKGALTGDGANNQGAGSSGNTGASAVKANSTNGTGANAGNGGASATVKATSTGNATSSATAVKANTGNMSIGKDNAINGMTNGDKNNAIVNANNTNSAVKNNPVGITTPVKSDNQVKPGTGGGNSNNSGGVVANNKNTTVTAMTDKDKKNVVSTNANTNAALGGKVSTSGGPQFSVAGNTNINAMSEKDKPKVTGNTAPGPQFNYGITGNNNVNASSKPPGWMETAVLDNRVGQGTLVAGKPMFNASGQDGNLAFGKPNTFDTSTSSQSDLVKNGQQNLSAVGDHNARIRAGKPLEFEGDNTDPQPGISTGLAEVTLQPTPLGGYANITPIELETGKLKADKTKLFGGFAPGPLPGTSWVGAGNQDGFEAGLGVSKVLDTPIPWAPKVFGFANVRFGFEKNGSEMGFTDPSMNLNGKGVDNFNTEGAEFNTGISANLSLNGGLLPKVWGTDATLPSGFLEKPTFLGLGGSIKGEVPIKLQSIFSERGGSGWMVNPKANGTGMPGGWMPRPLTAEETKAWNDSWNKVGGAIEGGLTNLNTSSTGMPAGFFPKNATPEETKAWGQFWSGFNSAVNGGVEAWNNFWSFVGESANNLTTSETGAASGWPTGSNGK